MNAIEINGLTKRFKNFKLDNIDFTLPGGWILGFGDKAKVLEPEEARTEFTLLAENIFNLYN